MRTTADVSQRLLSLDLANLNHAREVASFGCPASQTRLRRLPRADCFGRA